MNSVIFIISKLQMHKGAVLELLLKISVPLLFKIPFDNWKKWLVSELKLFKSNCQSLKEVVPLDWKKQVGQNVESVVIWVEVLRRFEDAGKNRWTRVDFSLVMVAIDLGL